MKKIIALLCALVLMLSLCAACSTAESTAPADDAAETAAEPAEAEDTAEAAETEAAEPADTGITTVDAGKLTVSTSPDFPPFEYTDDNGDIIGIEPEIIALIADKLGLELVIDAMDFDSALLAAQQGKSDAVVSGVTVTEDRKLVYDFTDTYISITQAIVCKEGAGITMDNLGEYSIGVQRGTTGHIYVEDDFGADAVVAYDTYSTAFQALMNDQIDCIVLDDAVAQAYLATYAGLEMVETTYEPEDYAFGVTKGNTALVDGINAALKELIADGTVQSIIDKYIAE